MTTRNEEEERRMIKRMVEAIENIADDIRDIRLFIEDAIHQDEECDEDG
jgi:hypothetical protein